MELSPAVAAEVERIRQLPESAAVSPTMPAHVYAIEVERLIEHAKTDKSAFLNRKFDWSNIDKLAISVPAFRYMEAIWSNKRFITGEAQRIWNDQKLEAVSLHGELIRESRFAFRRAPEKQAIIDRIDEGTGQADMIQDFVELAITGLDNSSYFEASGYSLDNFRRAQKLGELCGPLIGKSVDEREIDKIDRAMRDKAFGVIDEIVTDLLDHAEVIFGGTDRSRVYVSRYFKPRTKKATSDKDTVQSTEQTTIHV